MATILSGGYDLWYDYNYRICVTEKTEDLLGDQVLANNLYARYLNTKIQILEEKDPGEVGKIKEEQDQLWIKLGDLRKQADAKALSLKEGICTGRLR